MMLLSIQSHVAYGHVGNAAAVFPLQRLGIEVLPVHTVQFASHVGYGPPQGSVMDAAALGAVIDGLEARGALARCDGVLSGYLGSPALGAVVLDAVVRVRRHNPRAVYCCDPVIGDIDGGIYVAPEIVAFFRDCAIPQATIVTPNAFELAEISGRAIETLNDAKAAIVHLQRQGPRVVLATSLHLADTPKNMMDVVVADGARVARVRTPLLPGVLHGTGDLIAALFTAHYLRTGVAERAAEAAVSSVYGVIARTLSERRAELALVVAQDEFVAPTRGFIAEPVS
ncbi:MAG: pyridoxal kinase PdxY [Rhizobiales bacterium]|nr:pyridoxal kinase PdxY [Hyphomicrobiales bacterium]OJY42868.1 MAG: pyridoxal kinase [Rhizobiales bacterium 64-17]